MKMSNISDEDFFARHLQEMLKIIYEKKSYDRVTQIQGDFFQQV